MFIIEFYMWLVCLWSGFFFFKQKTAYEMRISDWSSDVCSSDLSIKGDDTLYIGEEEVRETELPARLEAIAAADANSENPRQIMLRADKSLDYRRVMRVLGELNRAGLTRIALVTTGGRKSVM